MLLTSENLQNYHNRKFEVSSQLRDGIDHHVIFELSDYGNLYKYNIIDTGVKKIREYSHSLINTSNIHLDDFRCDINNIPFGGCILSRTSAMRSSWPMKYIEKILSENTPDDFFIIRKSHNSLIRIESYSENAFIFDSLALQELRKYQVDY